MQQIIDKISNTLKIIKSELQNLQIMEKNKSNLTQSIKYLSKPKLSNTVTQLSATKSGDISLNKNKSKKTSLKNLIKATYVVKKNNKKGNDSLMYKTSICTPVDTTALMSCISTPNAKSIDKRNFLRNLQTQVPQPFKLSIKENFMSTDEGRGSQDSIKVKCIINSRLRFQKYFSYSETIEDIKKQVIQQMQKKQKKVISYLGFIGFYSVDNNLGIDKLLRTPQLQLSVFKKKLIYQLNIKAVLAKKQPNYRNLQFCDFQLIKYLGNGGFSSVYLARCLIDGQLCALKFIRKSSIVSQNKYKMLENQKNILFTIDHHRLVDLYYAFESKNYIVFGLQFCPNGNLYQLIQKRKTITQNQAKFVFSQILQGLQSLHSQKILFRDIKLQNILFDQNGNVKITDFGLSKPHLDEEDITYSYCGSPQYMAPEMLAKVGHTFQIDHYALGILLFELLYGHSPFFAPKKQDIFYAIINSQPHFPKNPLISKQVKFLIKGLLEKNPKHRIGSLKGIQEIHSHPWLRGYSTNNLQSPFKINLTNQNIQTDAEQLQRITSQFTEDMNVILKQKVFFGKSFVNKFLSQKLDKQTIVLKQKCKNDKKQKSIQKTKIKIAR